MLGSWRRALLEHRDGAPQLASGLEEAEQENVSDR
jgi:hypothetical protein